MGQGMQPNSSSCRGIYIYIHLYTHIDICIYNIIAHQKMHIYKVKRRRRNLGREYKWHRRATSSAPQHHEPNMMTDSPISLYILYIIPYFFSKTKKIQETHYLSLLIFIFPELSFFRFLFFYYVMMMMTVMIHRGEMIHRQQPGIIYICLCV